MLEGSGSHDDSPGSTALYLAVAVCVACLVACEPSSGALVRRVFSAEAGSCRLQLFVENVDGERLAFRYTFENHSDRSAYFFEEIEGTYRDDNTVVPNAAHPAFVIADESRVIVTKRIPAIEPGGPWPEQPTGPFATRVAPGGSETRTVELALPLAYYNPYVSLDEDLKGSSRLAEALGRQWALSEARRNVWFELGFILLPPSGDAVMDQYDRRRSNDGRVWYDFHLSHPERQTLLRLGPLAAARVRSFAVASDG